MKLWERQIFEQMNKVGRKGETKEEHKDRIWKASPLATLSIIPERTIRVSYPHLLRAHPLGEVSPKNSIPKKQRPASFPETSSCDPERMGREEAIEEDEGSNSAS